MGRAEELQVENDRLREANRRLQAEGEELERDKLVRGLRAALDARLKALEPLPNVVLTATVDMDAIDAVTTRYMGEALTMAWKALGGGMVLIVPKGVKLKPMEKDQVRRMLEL